MAAKIKTVLLVEDNHDDIFYSKRIINNTGWAEQIDVCHDGSTALDYLLNRGEYAMESNIRPSPDLILLDLSLPRMNGWDFLAAYAALPASYRRHTVVVILTASLDPNDEARALTTGVVNRYIIKPLKELDFKRLMSEAFPSRFS